MLFDTDNISDAFMEFKNLENINPNYKNLNYYMALCYQKEKNYSAVLEYGQRALNETPYNPSVYMLLAQNYIDLNKIDEAFKIFEKGFDKGIKDSEYFLAWGISLIRAEKIPEAIDVINKSLEIKNNDSIALYRLGYCYYKQNDLDKAEEYYKKAIFQDSSNSSAIADLGIIFYDRKNYTDAIKTFFKAIDISTEKAYLYFYIANCYYKMDRLKKAIDYYEKTIEYYPNHIEAYINYTMCLLKTENYKEASRKIRTAYQLNRKSEKVIMIYALTNLKSGIYADVIEKADMLLEINENNIQAKMLKAQALINIHKAPEALDILSSIPENEKSSYVFIYLSYLAYKVLVEDSPSNYNENMLNQYSEKIEEMNSLSINSEGLSDYIGKTLNINKG